jgi:hypothetical protein
VRLSILRKTQVWTAINLDSLVKKEAVQGCPGCPRLSKKYPIRGILPCSKKQCPAKVVVQ